MQGPMLKVAHRTTGLFAIAVKGPPGRILIQMNRLDHPHSHGWHEYPRKDWRYRSKRQ